MNVRRTGAMLMILGLAAAAHGQGSWTELTPSGSPSFAHHDMRYDSVNERLVVCGRAASDGVISTYFSSDGETWTPGPSATSSFPAQFGNDVEVAFDAVRGVTVLYTSDASTTETWELAEGAWALKTVVTQPVACADGALFQFDPGEQKCLLVGGAGWPDPGLASETWLWDGADWTQAASGDPVGAAGGGMAYDAARGEMVLLTMIKMNTWVFREGAWTLKSPDTAPSPGVWVFDMAYDAAGQQVIFFGGEGGSWPDVVYPTNTWAWDGVDWMLLATTGAPPSSIDHAMSYLPSRSGVVMHGGWASPDWSPRDMVWLFASGAGTTPVEGLRIGRDGENIVLTWDAAPGASGYEVTSADHPGHPFAPDASGTFSGARWEKDVTGVGSEFYSVSATE